MAIIQTFFTVGILIILLETIDVSNAAVCSDHTDCNTCTSHTTWTGAPCPWCPLTQSCHAKGSWYNHCSNDQNIQNEDKCESDESSQYAYDADEAYKLALLSAVSYNDAPRKCLNALFPDGDYKIARELKRKCDDYFFLYTHECVAVVVTSQLNKEVIVAFRGSKDVYQVVEQVLTTIGVPSVDSPVGGKVQNYFQNIFNKFYASLKWRLSSLMEAHPDYKVKFTGHSLGGAVASITAAMFVNSNIIKSEDVSLYTYGMPKVGNKDYALAFDKLVPNSWRVVRQGDPITVLPTCVLGPLCTLLNGPFHHGNKVIYTDDEMTKDSTYLVCDGNEDTASECTRIEQEEKAAADVRYSRRSSLVRKHVYYFGIRLEGYCNSVMD